MFMHFLAMSCNKQATTYRCNGQVFSAVNCEGIIKCVFVFLFKMCLYTFMMWMHISTLAHIKETNIHVYPLNLVSTLILKFEVEEVEMALNFGTLKLGRSK